MDGAGFTKEPSVIEQKAYRDTWGRGLNSYIHWFYETAVLLHELLAETGSVFVHVGGEMTSYVRVVLDEVFSQDNFLNEVVWKRSDAHNDVGQGARFMGRIHDSIFVYGKSESYTWNSIFLPLPESTVEKWYRYVEPGTGRRYNRADLTARKRGGDTRYEWKGAFPPPGRYWAYSRANMERLEKEERLEYSSSGMPYMKRYLDESKGVPLQDLWDDISMLRGISGTERIGYPTQKPEALLERVIKASSNEGDLVLDCFAGSGTTVVVAEKLGRRWIAADLGRFAIHTTRKRLLGIPDVKPFVVQNLGKYERQVWQAAEFGDQAEARQLAYRKFILDLYRARPISGYAWLHGLRNGRMVHVGSVDAPVSPGDVTQIVAEFRKTIGTGADAPTTSSIDILGWDFAFELHEVARQQAALARVDARFVRIPRDVMDKRAVEQGDIDFFELAALNVDVATKGRAVTVTLTDFVIPMDDVPADVQKAITNWAQWIDYWAVDWDNRSDTFHNQWQTYRTRQNRDLQKSAGYTYPEPGRYRLVVKVIDILGNDTTKVLAVEVP